MSLTEILNKKKTSAKSKLKDVAQVVAGARENYGNAKVKIACPSCNTAEGSMPFNMLDADSKVELLKDRLPGIKARAVEANTRDKAVVINREIEKQLAIDPYFANVGNGVKFEYI